MLWGLVCGDIRYLLTGTESYTLCDLLELESIGHRKDGNEYRQQKHEGNDFDLGMAQAQTLDSGDGIGRGG